MGAPRRYRAYLALSSALIALVGLYLSATLFLHLQAASAVGESDGANALVVARNVAEGRGFSVDYVATYLRAWGSVHHPEDSFPLFHPLLIGLTSLATRDVVVASHLLSSVFLWLYLAGLPLLVARFWGPTPSLLFAAGLLSQESSYSLFARPLNDAPAMVFFGALVIFVARSIEVEDARSSRRALIGSAVSAALATQLKLSVAFFVIAVVFAFVCLDRHRSRKEGLRRASLVFGAALLASVPLLVWHVATFGTLGLPQNAIGRGFAREAGAAPEFWPAFERIRVFLPAHPEFLRTTIEWAGQEGFFAVFLRAPLRRVLSAVSSGFIDGTVVALPLVGLTALSLASFRKTDAVRLSARLLWMGAFAALLIPVYSHFEPRYLMPLRPLVAFVAAMGACEVASELSERSREHLALTATIAYAAAVVWGATHAYEWNAGLVLWGGLGLACGASLVWRALGSQGIASAARGATLGFSFCFVLLSANGARALLSPIAPDPDRERGAFLAATAGEGVTLVARRVWSLSFWSRLPLVMIPYHAEDTCAAARMYGATGIVIEDADRERQPDLARVLGEPMGIEPGFGIYRLACDPPSP